MIARQPEAAVYRQLAADLRARIADGRLQPGQRLPSEPHLGQTYGVARETVRRAVRLLVAEGLLSVRAGRGTWVREAPDETLVPVPRKPGSRAFIRSRPATPSERAEHDLPDGAHVLELRRDDDVHVWPADRTVLGIW